MNNELKRKEGLCNEGFDRFGAMITPEKIVNKGTKGKSHQVVTSQSKEPFELSASTQALASCLDCY